MSATLPVNLICESCARIKTFDDPVPGAGVGGVERNWRTQSAVEALVADGWRCERTRCDWRLYCPDCQRQSRRGRQ